MPPAIRVSSPSRGREAARAGDPAKKPDWRTTATTVAGLVSVLLVAAGLFYTNDANRKQQQLGLDQQKLALQGQVADRFTAAIDQLGQEDNKKQDKLSIRLGGLYGLQQLMNDAPAGEPVEPAVVQVLCAFVRTHAPRPATPSKTVPPSPADVRASITVHGNRPNPSQYPLDLSNTLLGLDHADLHGADLRGADLNDADLINANLYNADLHGADLHGADLHGADLHGADLHGADLNGAVLYNAGLRGADLNGARLIRAGLSDADLHSAHLNDAYLREAGLDGSDLSDAGLRGADLNDADLSGADLSGADLSGADLNGADLHGAGLREAVGVTPQLLARTQVDERTRLPSGDASPSPAPSR